jgi:hypothetical protein
MQNLFIQNFRGIRKVNPVVDVAGAGIISAVTSSNVELKYTENGDNVGIFTAKGNKAIKDIEKTVIGQFESVQSGITYWFIYAVDSEQGYIYLYNTLDDSLTLIKEGLAVNNVANGITIAQGYDDWFVFTNGIDDYLAICMAKELAEDRVQFLNAVDAEEREIRGLGLEAYDGRLVTFCENRVHWSAQANIFDWKGSNPELVTAPAYQEFDRNITAIIYYNDMLIAFTSDYSTYFKGNPGDAVNFERGGASGGGCASFKSVIKFDNKLFYYDNKAKNVFAYYLLDSGQTRPTNGLADNVIEYFAGLYKDKLQEIEVVSYVAGDRSEIWFKLPYLDENKILIFDYLKQEWISRKAQEDIKALAVVDGALYSASGSKVLKEYITSDFNGVFIPAEYKMNVINVGSDSNLKVPKMPLIMTLDFDYENDFYIEFIYDDKPERSKTKRIIKLSKSYLTWAESQTSEVGGFWAFNEDDANGGVWVSSDKNNVMFNLAGLLNFKQLQIKLFTAEKGQEFGIKRFELKRVKTKSKTIG